MSYANLADDRSTDLRVSISVSPAAVVQIVGEQALQVAGRALVSLTRGIGSRKHALRRRHSADALARLSDRSLRDIGVRRDQIVCLCGHAAAGTDRDRSSGTQA